MSNGRLKEEAKLALLSVADDVLERENVGYDVGAYRDAFSHVGWDELSQFDELLMVNYTFFGPVGSFGPVLEQMGESGVDFWGITDHPRVTPDPVSGKGTMPAHLQSFWLAVRRPLLASDAFRSYWIGLEDPTSYEGVITSFETRFTEHFSELGFKWKAAYPASDYGVRNSAMEAPLALLRDGCPLFKKRLYFHDAPWLARQGVFSGSVTAEAVKLGYPEELVLEGVHRRATARELSFGMDATFMVPPSSDDGCEVADDAGEFTTIVGSPWKRLATNGVEAVLGDAKILIVDSIAPRRGHLSDGAVSSYNYAHSAVVEASGFVSGRLLERPLMAAVFPYMDLLSEPVDGRKWFSRTKVAESVAEALGLSGPFSHTSVLAPYRSIAAYRRELLESASGRIERAGGWSALTRVAGDENTLVRILDLLVGDIAKEEGWFVGQVGTETELRRSASLLQDAYSRKPYVQPGYLDYPYSGQIAAPSFKSKVGHFVRQVSPSAFETLHSMEARVKEAVRGERDDSK
ncbi:MAG: rhamnan synthesis F family protein [Scrofimicrobium sp.]